MNKLMQSAINQLPEEERRRFLQLSKLGGELTRIFAREKLPIKDIVLLLSSTLQTSQERLKLHGPDAIIVYEEEEIQ